MTEPQAGWLVLAAFFGALAYLLSHLAHAAIRRWRPPPPQRFAAWMARVEALAAERVRCALASADVEVQLAEMVGKVPADFDGAVFAAARLGHAVERAALDEAVRLSLVRPEDAEAIRRGAYSATASVAPAPVLPAAPERNPGSVPPESARPPESGRVVPFLLKPR